MISDDDQYVLASVEPNVDAAAALLLRKNIKDDKKLAKSEKDRLLTVVDSPADA